jgi:hypothetical protein
MIRMKSFEKKSGSGKDWTLLNPEQLDFALKTLARNRIDRMADLDRIGIAGSSGFEHGDPGASKAHDQLLVLLQQIDMEEAEVKAGIARRAGND